MVFGVFDGLHEGHRHFLASAADMCERLSVVVAPDIAAVALKGRSPMQPLTARIAAITSLNPSLTVLPGDEAQGSWKVFESHTPDVVMLGYDQKEIASALEARGIPYIYMDAHKPERFKSSILNSEKPSPREGS